MLPVCVSMSILGGVLIPYIFWFGVQGDIGVFQRGIHKINDLSTTITFQVHKSGPLTNYYNLRHKRYAMSTDTFLHF